MIKQVFRQYIADADFKSLFNALGWNRYQGLAEFNEEIDGFSYHFRIVGQIKGFQVIVCDNAEHITASLCKRNFVTDRMVNLVDENSQPR